MSSLKIQLALANDISQKVNVSEKEFNIYRERETQELQSDFDLLMKSLPNNNVVFNE